MKVRATRNGYYDHLRRRVGDVFKLRPIKGKKMVKGEDGKERLVDHTFSVKEQFSANWMEEVDKGTPESISTAQQAVSERNAEIKLERAAQKALDQSSSSEVI